MINWNNNKVRNKHNRGSIIKRELISQIGSKLISRFHQFQSFSAVSFLFFKEITSLHRTNLTAPRRQDFFETAFEQRIISGSRKIGTV